MPTSAAASSKVWPSPVDAWQVIGVSAVEGRFDARRGIALTPLVGRIEELGLLLRRWEHAKAGEGQVVLLSGEAGIGKSRIIQTLREQLAAQPHTRLIYYCSALHVNSSLFPVLAQLERAAGLARDEPPERQLDKLEELLGRAVADVRGVAPLVAALLSIPDRGRYPPLNMSPQRQKEKTLEALLAQLDGFAARAPVLMVFEDVHWIDPTSRELLDLTVERVQSLRAMLVVTHRPEFVSPWIGQAHVTLLSLNRLGRRQGTAMIEQLTGGKILPAPVLEQIAAKSDGVPLFVEELTKAVLEFDLLRDEGDRYALTGPLPEFAVPATLRDSLMARLDRTALIKEVAQIGAALGREFSYELLSEVAPLDENTLREGLAQLCSCELVFRRGAPPDATYVFKHALVQDAAYSSLLKSKRQQLHSRIAQVIEERFPETAQSQPELLARHYSQACLIGPAVDCWLKAGQLALTRSATAEAVAQLSEGLELLSDLPGGLERSERELDLQVTLGGALIAANGFAAPETGRAWARARELCQQLQLPQSPRLAKAMYGQYVFYHVRAEFGASRGVAEEMLRLAEGQDDPVYRLMGHRTLGNVLVVLGELVEAREHLERALALYDSAQHRSLAMHYTFDPRIASLSYLSLALVALGYPDQALLRSREAVAYANELCHFNSVAQALFFGCVAHQLLGDRRAVHEQADAVISLSNEQGFPVLVGRGPGPSGLGGGERGPLRRGSRRDARGPDRIRRNRGGRPRAVFRRPRGRRLRPRRHGRDGARAGAGGGRADGRGLVRARAAPPHGRARVRPTKEPSRSGSLLRPGDRASAPARHAPVGVASGDEPRAPLAPKRQAGRSARPAYAAVRLVHGGLRYTRPPEGQGAAGGFT